MLKQSKGEVTTFLTLVNDVGCGSVRTSVLKSWFGAKNLSKTIWREIHEEWQKIGSCELLLVGVGEGGYAFVYGRGLAYCPNTKSEDRWLEDIRDWF